MSLRPHWRLQFLTDGSSENLLEAALAARASATYKSHCKDAASGRHEGNLANGRAERGKKLLSELRRNRRGISGAISKEAKPESTKFARHGAKGKRFPTSASIRAKPWPKACKSNAMASSVSHINRPCPGSAMHVVLKPPSNPYQAITIICQKQTGGIGTHIGGPQHPSALGAICNRNPGKLDLRRRGGGVGKRVRHDV